MKFSAIIALMATASAVHLRTKQAEDVNMEALAREAAGGLFDRCDKFEKGDGQLSYDELLDCIPQVVPQEHQEFGAQLVQAITWANDNGHLTFPIKKETF